MHRSLAMQSYPALLCARFHRQASNDGRAAQALTSSPLYFIGDADTEDSESSSHEHEFERGFNDLIINDFLESLAAGPDTGSWAAGGGDNLADSQWVARLIEADAAAKEDEE